MTRKKDRQKAAAAHYQAAIAKQSPAAKMELVSAGEAPNRGNKDIGKFVRALKNADNPKEPNRIELYDIYNDTLSDLHLQGIRTKRIEHVRQLQLTFTDGNKTDEAIQALIESTWFGDMLEDVLDSRLWGHSAMWLDLSGGIFRSYKLLDRKHVIPEQNLFKVKQGDRSGIDYTQGKYPYYVLTAGKPHDLGMLLNAVPMVLIKRGDISDWATCNELFAAPTRIGKYPAYRDDIRAQLLKAMQDAGSFANIVIPQEAEYTHVSNAGSGTGSSAYNALADFCNKEMSKGFLLSTLTMDAEGGKYKGDVHADSEQIILNSDRIYVEKWLNTTLLPLLSVHGFNVGNGWFSFAVEDRLCIKDRLEMDIKLNDIVDYPPEYWYEKYNIPIPKGGAKLKGVQTEPSKKELKLSDIPSLENSNDPKPRTLKDKVLGFFA